MAVCIVGWVRWIGVIALLATGVIGCGGGGGGGGSNDGSNEVPQPEIVSSRDGVLRYTLQQAPAEIVVAGQRFTSNVFNGQYMAPVLKLQRGDWMELTLRNRIGPADIQIDQPQESNLHYHGMSITPVAPGDDVFLHISAGADYRYRWQVPERHPQGAHWYHPHAHGQVEPQILSGMSGLLMVDGLVGRHFPAFAGLPEKHFVLRDIALPGADDAAPLTKTINGVVGKAIPMRPGEMQIWHLGNLGANAYFDLAIDDLQVWEISRDGNVLPIPRRLQTVFLPPGSRATVVVLATTAAGSYAMRSRAIDTGPQGDPNPEVQLATVRVAGSAIDSTALQAALTAPTVNQDTTTALQLAAKPITRRRTITFSETEDGNTFFIDGKLYDVARDDVTVRLGDIEEWTLRNVSAERHVFHIHQMDFLVTTINNQDIDETGLRDVVDIPSQQGGVPGEVKVIVPFDNPEMVGRFVFHCHIVEHEDGGMMANVVVLPPEGTAPVAARMRTITSKAQPNPLQTVVARTADLFGLKAKDGPEQSVFDDSICRGSGVANPVRLSKLVR